MDKILEKIAGLGVPKLVLLVVIAISIWSGIVVIITVFTLKSTRPSPKSKISQKEKIICQRLAKKIPYSKREVVTPSGRIDILTPSKIIEVKNVRQYKHAIGQVISYSYYYPNHQRCIYLFGKVSLKKRALIEKECQLAKVTVTFQ